MKQCKSHSVKGKIHSLESFGAQDGPGIRYVVFMQGCVARCMYCQNPDTWELNAGTLMSAEEVFEKIERCLPYLNSSKGGVTISGGEPLLQPDFLIDLFNLCRRNSVHTAIDTSGFYPKEIDPKKINKVINLTDLFIMDIKASSIDLHKSITSRELKDALSFIKKLEKKNKRYWIRYVLVPDLNDYDEDMEGLKAILSNLKNCKKLEFLPYHTLGKHKWEHLGMKYPLENFRAANQGDMKKALSKFGK
ncbi:MAG TPA: pyruvate formate lyase-activating protein [Candidatus Omnitrophica bacterium]|nr:pyruvate formate lyase-activating protein [Candidatus Omnitrophota bacterium]